MVRLLAHRNHWRWTLIVSVPLVAAGLAGRLAHPAASGTLGPAGVVGPAGAVSPTGSAAYQAALKRGLGGDLVGAQAEFLKLAGAQRGTALGAQALYQAGLAAEGAGDQTRREQAFADLRREYPGYFLARRVTPGRKLPTLDAKTVHADCGPRALELALRRLGRTATLDALRKQAETTARGTTLEGLAAAARSNGVKARGVQMDRTALAQVSTPALAWVDGDHFVALLSVSENEAVIHDPNHGKEETIGLDDLIRRSGGVLLLLSR
jgi:hypothetical protein